MKVLGIDPSLSSTGWVLLNDEKIYDFGLIKTKIDTKNRLYFINQRIKNIMEAYEPDEIHVETPFFGKNGRTGMHLAYLRGGIILLCEHLEIPLVSFSPQEIKKQITGNGRAEKEEVAAKLTDIFKDDEQLSIIGPFSNRNNKNKTSDIYDALAVAHCIKKDKKGEI